MGLIHAFSSGEKYNNFFLFKGTHYMPQIPNLQSKTNQVRFNML